MAHINKKTLDDYIPIFKIVHKNFYGYEKSVYFGAREKIEIVCPYHGSFWQSPDTHKKGHGCYDCGIYTIIEKKSKLITDYIPQFNKIYDNFYGYEKSVYLGARIKTEVVCPLHGCFWVSPNKHMQGLGCKQCSNGGTSKNEQRWILSLGIKHIETQKNFYLSDGSRIKADGYDPITNTIYEYHGKYWHGHPDRSDPDELIKGKSAGDRYIETLIREIRLKELGYNLISFWGE
jgi:hypothetical protein